MRFLGNVPPTQIIGGLFCEIRRSGRRRLTAFATNTRRGQLAGLELRHRQRARCDDGVAKDIGLANLPLHRFDQNRIWCAIVHLAMDLLAGQVIYYYYYLSLLLLPL
jgi:hypothetical protein